MLVIGIGAGDPDARHRAGRSARSTAADVVLRDREGRPTPRSWSGCGSEILERYVGPPTADRRRCPTRRATAPRPPPTAPRSRTGAGAAPTQWERCASRAAEDGCRRLPRVGRPGALRQHAGGRSTGAGAGQRRLRSRGHPRDQQRAGARRRATACRSTASAARCRSRRAAAARRAARTSVDDVVVMLDAELHVRAAGRPTSTIYWGAYARDARRAAGRRPGSPTSADEIQRVRRAGARAQGLDHGRLPVAAPARASRVEVAVAEALRGERRADEDRSPCAGRPASWTASAIVASVPRRTTSSGQLARATTAAGQSAP